MPVVVAVKLACPYTRVAVVVPLGKYKTRLLLFSLTYRLPLVSNANLKGPFKPVAEAPAVLVVKTVWPYTRDGVVVPLG